MGSKSKQIFSKFGQKLGAHTGILELMDDLGRAMSGQDRVLMLGGGNPAGVPEVQAIWRRRMAELLAQPERFDAMLGNYDVPQGRPAFIQALVQFLNKRYGWGLTPANITVTSGSQTAFFCLFNMLAGDFGGGRRKKILLPLCPEYIGYADHGLCPGLFHSLRPAIELRSSHSFKYHVDFSKLSLDESVGGIVVSRPTNPTGNVLTNGEIEQLAALARKHEVPLLVDCAYGAPFPGIIFHDVQPVWDQNRILVLSLSKLGLPGVRTGIVIAREEISRALTGMNAVVNLANCNVGQELVVPLLRDGSIEEICRKSITPFYAGKRQQALNWIYEFFPDDVPYYLHSCEGALFFWLWCQDLPISAKELYDRLKARRVIVVPGHYFFFGLSEPWRHSDECLRINYSQPDDVVREGLKIIGEEIRKAYRG